MKNQTKKNLFTKLLDVDNDSFFVYAIKNGINEGRRISVLKMIIDQAKDNRPLVEKLIGAGLLKQAEYIVERIKKANNESTN